MLYEYCELIKPPQNTYRPITQKEAVDNYFDNYHPSVYLQTELEKQGAAPRRPYDDNGEHAQILKNIRDNPTYEYLYHPDERGILLKYPLKYMWLNTYEYELAIWYENEKYIKELTRFPTETLDRTLWTVFRNIYLGENWAMDA